MENGNGTREREENGQEKERRGIYPGRTKDCLWVEERQMETIGKWKFIKVKGETCVRMSFLILIEHIN